MIEEPKFDTCQIDSLMAAETGELDLIALKRKMLDAPSSPKKYAEAHDIIAVFETTISYFEDRAEELESMKRRVENALRMEIEIKAESKDSKLTNEKKRQIAYEELADCNEELQGIIYKHKNVRRGIKQYGIELRNEQRAYALKVAGAKV